MGKYVFIKKDGDVIVKSFNSEKKAWEYAIGRDFLVWDNPSGVIKWLSDYKPNWLASSHKWVRK